MRSGIRIRICLNTHTHLTALFLGLPKWASTKKVKPIWNLLKQETVSGSGISWTICKSALCSRQITTPAPSHSSFLQAGCPSCRPINSIKALKAIRSENRLPVGNRLTGLLEHSNSGKKKFWFDSRYWIDFFDSIQQSDKFATCRPTLIFK